MIFKLKIPKEIKFLIIFSLILILVRYFLLGNKSLNWIIWNMFLAFIPFAISYFLFYLHQQNKLKISVFIIFGIIGLLFLPNAPYLITDLIHVKNSGFVPPVYDAFLLFSSALVGILFFNYSMFYTQNIFEKIFINKKVRNILFILIFLLTSIGVYLGRFLRFNSWDILTNHIGFPSDLIEAFSRYSDHGEAFLHIILFFSSLLVFYYSWKIYKKNEI